MKKVTALIKKKVTEWRMKLFILFVIKKILIICPLYDVSMLDIIKQMKLSATQSEWAGNQINQKYIFHFN